ncbi:hypothetical protein LAV72_17865 [Lysinibacillus xylanilyticus]|uniref:hypothetical protein n=1 Tax=Lysinibacillus xylanilyticus TaxID=582475 RepID=UPI002B24F273|nr:hypothetical protein [Lysinibacillus xylanilyticus]MEB2301475.1 hypothetical protein [Lysinibacillus xylanilyticus]
MNVEQLNRDDFRFDYIPVGECLLALCFRAENICRWRSAFAQKTFVGPTLPFGKRFFFMEISLKKESNFYITS